jgi:transposase
MVNYREILRLNSLKYSQHQIAVSVHSSRNTIREVLQSAKSLGLEWPLDDSATNEVIMALLYPNRNDAVNPRKEPDYSYIHRELAKPGVNLTLLWTEYCSECNAQGHTPYMYSQFCDKYRHWARITKATMRIRHKPGDAMQVDWAGTTIQYQDPITGKTQDTYIFAAVLPCMY